MRLFENMHSREKERNEDPIVNKFEKKGLN